MTNSSKHRLTFDHAVIGGGFAGVAAALASARNGASTCLVERTAALGGLSTQGLVVVFLPLCDGFGRQVTYGIPEELLRLPMRHSAAKPSKDRYELVFDPGPMMLGLEQLLSEAGVTLLYDTDAIGAEVRDGRLLSVGMDRAGERWLLAANVFTDATGSAALARLCGVPTLSGLAGNTPGGWYYVVDHDRRVSLRCHAGRAFTQEHPDEAVPCDGGEPNARNRHLLASRRAILLDNARENERLAAEGKPPVHIFSIPTYSTLLKQRRLDGPCGGPVVGIVSDWRKRGPVYPIGLDSLRAPGMKNLLAAGRCIACDEALWDIMRCLPACCASGQAAGTAAALLPPGGDLSALNPDTLRTKLEADGVRLDASLLVPSPDYRPDSPPERESHAPVS